MDRVYKKWFSGIKKPSPGQRGPDPLSQNLQHVRPHYLTGFKIMKQRRDISLASNEHVSTPTCRRLPDFCAIITRLDIHPQYSNCSCIKIEIKMELIINHRLL